MPLPFNISEPKHVIKKLRFLSISQIKIFENETSIVVTTDFSTRGPSLETSNSVYIVSDNQRTGHFVCL